jgi:hypothetical protein
MDRKQPESNPVQEALRPTHLSMRRELNCNRGTRNFGQPVVRRTQNRWVHRFLAADFLASAPKDRTAARAGRLMQRRLSKLGLKDHDARPEFAQGGRQMASCVVEQERPWLRNPFCV